MIELSFIVSEAEFLEAGLQLARRPVSVIRLVGFPIAGAGFIYLHETMFGIALIIFGIALPILRPRKVREALHRTYQGAPFMQTQISARLDEGGTVITYLKGSSTNTWDAYQGCFETKDLIVLKLSTTFLRIFPKRAFSPEQLLEFRELLQNHKLSPSK